MTVKEDLGGYYEYFENYFKDDLEFPPMRQKPKIISVLPKDTSIKDGSVSKWKDGKLLIIKANRELTRAIIALECLQSFFNENIRKNPLLLSYSYRRLILGKAPLYKSEKKELKELYELRKSDIKKTLLADKLLSTWQGFDSEVIPEFMPEYSFKQIIVSFANYSEFITENDSEFIDAVLTDCHIGWTALEYSLEELDLLNEIGNLFKNTKLPFSFKFLKNSLEKNEKENLENVENVFNSLKEKAFFFYRCNYKSINLQSVLCFIRFNKNINKEIVDFCLNNLMCLYSFRDNNTQGFLIKHLIFTIIPEDIPNLKRFLTSLKNYGIIEEYILFSREKLKHIINFPEISGSGKVKSISTVIDCEGEFDKYTPDILDLMIIRFSSRIKTGFGFLERDRNLRIKAEIMKWYNNYNIKLNMLKTIKEKTENLYIDIPKIKILIPVNLKNPETLGLKVSIKKMLNIIIKNWGVFSGKYYFKLISEIFSGLSIILSSRVLKKISSKSLTEFIDSDSFKRQHFSTYLSLKTSIRSLESFFKNTVKQTEFKTFLSNVLIYFNNIRNNLDKYIEIANISSDFLGICTDYNIRGIDNQIIKETDQNLRNLLTYYHKTDFELKQDIEDRLEKMVKIGLLIPDISDSMRFSNNRNSKLLLLKNIDFNDKKFLLFDKLFPHIYRIKGKSVETSDEFIDIMIDDYVDTFENSEYFIKKLFGKDILLYGKFFMDPFEFINKLDNNYIFEQKRFKSLKSVFNDIVQFLKDYSDNTSEQNPILVVNSDESENLEFIEEKTIDKKPIDIGYSTENPFQYNYHRIGKKTLYEIVTEFQNYKPLLNSRLNCESENVDFLKKVVPEINWEEFGLSKYIVQFNLRKESFETGGINADTGEFLLCPGITKIESTGLSYLQNNFIHYIFPKNDPSTNILKYAARRNLITPYRLMKVKRIYLTHEFGKNYQFGVEKWKTVYITWSKLVEKILFHPDFRNFPSNYTELNFISDNEQLYSAESEEQEIIKKNYDKDLRIIYNLKFNSKLRNLIKQGTIIPFPEFDFDKLNLKEKVMIFFGPVTETNKKLLLKAFSTLPYVKIYDVEYTLFKKKSKETNLNNDGLLIELHLPDSKLGRFYWALEQIAAGLDIKITEFIPGVHSKSPSDFSNGIVKALQNPFEAHKWSKRTKKYFRIKYFDKVGRPLKHNQRKEQLG
ncbi:MAG: hypothetical protein ACTSWY_06915 [Promethearchaeota archaeon]